MKLYKNLNTCVVIVYILPYFCQGQYIHTYTCSVVQAKISLVNIFKIIINVDNYGAQTY